MLTWKKMMRVCVAGVLAPVVLASCGGSSKGKVVPPPAPRREGALSIQVLQSENGQQYRYRQAGRRITVTAPATNRPFERAKAGELGKNNIGEAFWSGHQAMRSDQQACVTWVTMADGSTQKAAQRIFHDPSQVSSPGIALRVRPPRSVGDPVKAVVINPIGLNGLLSGFAVLGFSSDLGGRSAVPVVGMFPSMIFADALGWMQGKPDSAEFKSTLKPPPWHVCARAVGVKISVMVWTGDEKQPSWSDDIHVKTVSVPPSWVYQGYAGAYISQLAPSRTAIFDDLKVTSPY